MENVSDPSAATGRVKKRLIIPSALIAIIAGFLVWGILHGNLTDAGPSTPASASDGVLTQLIRTSEGRKQIHAAEIVMAPPESVWKVVTDYDHFSEVFPNMATSKGVKDADGRWHLSGEVRSVVGRWPMDLHVQHAESASKSVASWDEPNGELKVDRGSWVVTPHGNGETLLEYNLELKVSPFPDFIVRAILLEQLKPVMKAVANRAQRAQGDQSPR
jgi:uncharacterized protein YndB with AHSA1/START domain